MTFKGSLGDYIMLDPDDVPTVQEMEHAVGVLKKCGDLYKTMKRRKDPPPESMEMVASFLETFIAKYEKQMKKGS